MDIQGVKLPFSFDLKKDANLILHIIPLLAGTALLAHPDVTQTELETKVEGYVWDSLKHLVGHNGWIVDILHGIPAIDALVHQAISVEIAKAFAQIAAPIESPSIGQSMPAMQSVGQGVSGQGLSAQAGETSAQVMSQDNAFRVTVGPTSEDEAAGSAEAAHEQAVEGGAVVETPHVETPRATVFTMQ